jgi:hypothetical protein
MVVQLKAGKPGGGGDRRRSSVTQYKAGFCPLFAFLSACYFPEGLFQ